MSEYIVVGDDQCVYLQEINEDEIVNLIGSEFVSAVLRVNTENGKIEYADTWTEDKLIWKIPESRGENGEY